MPGGDDRPIDLDVRGGSGPDDAEVDAIEVGWPGLSVVRRWRFGVVGLVCAALVLGALAAYYVTSSGARPKTGLPAPTGAVPTTRLLVGGPGQPPTVTGSRCSVQIGASLQLGLEIVNSSTADTTLLGVEVQLPLVGLKLTRVVWGRCSQRFASDGATPYPLPAGATAWLTMTFDVQIPCPAALPVQVTLRYSRGHEPAVTPLGGFSDLGEVPYTGCSESPG